MANLNDNPDYILLFNAYKKVQEVSSKTDLSVLLSRETLTRSNSEISRPFRELQKLHGNYARLLDWLNKPENSEAKAEFAALEICTALNSFFRA